MWTSCAVVFAKPICNNIMLVIEFGTSFTIAICLAGARTRKKLNELHTFGDAQVSVIPCDDIEPAISSERIFECLCSYDLIWLLFPNNTKPQYRSTNRSDGRSSFV